MTPADVVFSSVLVGTRTVAYRRAGSGSALVLLHGFTQDSRIWRPQLEGMSDEFSVIAWDAPGAGGSDDPFEPFGIEDWASDLAGFLDALEIGRAHVVGLSWGGLLAQELYRRAPTVVRSLVLADTYAGWKGSLPDAVADERLAACLRESLLPPSEFVARYLPGMFSDAVTPEIGDELGAIMAEFHPAGFRMMASALAEADTRDLLPLIQAPTLLIWGDEDARSPLSVLRQFAGAIPGAQATVLRGAGHVSNLERPHEFDAAVRAFCRTVN
jgi:pimeloyl-ACP methyl ester carboxylesterase